MRILQLLLPLLFRRKTGSRGGGLMTMTTVIVLLGAGAYLSRQFPWIGRLLESGMRMTTGIGSPPADASTSAREGESPRVPSGGAPARDRSTSSARPGATGPDVIDGSLEIRDVSEPTAADRLDGAAGEREVAAKAAEKARDAWVTAEAVVDRILADDTQSPRHQQWILRFPSGRTVKVAHNIDLAPRVPIRERGSMKLRGQFNWNEQGGLIHFTHKPAYGKGSGGWIEVEGKRYE